MTLGLPVVIAHARGRSTMLRRPQLLEESGIVRYFAGDCRRAERRPLLERRQLQRRHRARRAIADGNDLVALDPCNVRVGAQRRHHRLDLRRVRHANARREERRRHFSIR